MSETNELATAVRQNIGDVRKHLSVAQQLVRANAVFIEPSVYSQLAESLAIIDSAVESLIRHTNSVR